MKHMAAVITHGPMLMHSAMRTVPARMRLTHARTVRPRPMRDMIAPEVMAVARATQ